MSDLQFLIEWAHEFALFSTVFLAGLAVGIWRPWQER